VIGCEGNGQLCIEMHFLPMCGSNATPVVVALQPGDSGRHLSTARFLSDVAGHDLWRMRSSCSTNVPKIRESLPNAVRCAWIISRSGAGSHFVGGGGAARQLQRTARPDTGRTLYLLDRAHTGLHFEDLAKLLEVSTDSWIWNTGSADRTQSGCDQIGGLGARHGAGSGDAGDILSSRDAGRIWRRTPCRVFTIRERPDAHPCDPTQ